MAFARLFALSRMVDVLHYNMNRIYDLWGIFLSHVLEVLASPKPALRSAAMEAVGTAINGALAEPASPAEPASVDSNGAARNPESSDSFERGVEHMLLVALTALYTDDRDMDVRLGVLRVAITVLQRHGALDSCHTCHATLLVCRTGSEHSSRSSSPSAGERLSVGWVPLLRLLAAVPERGEAEAISLAFQSVQLMCSDFMSSLPADQLRKCLEVAALYAGQKASG